jgi:hypothetical protein
MRDKNGNTIAVGQRAVVLVDGWLNGFTGVVQAVADETATVANWRGSSIRWCKRFKSHEIAVVDDAAGEGKA